MKKHTPGPWLIVDHRKDIKEGIWIGVNHPKWDFCSHAVVRPGCGEASELGSDLANAHLISAAPELLEVAKLIIEEWDKDTDGVQRGELIARLSQYARKAGHAIAKAEGRGDGSYKSKK